MSDLHTIAPGTTVDIIYNRLNHSETVRSVYVGGSANKYLIIKNPPAVKAKGGFNPGQQLTIRTITNQKNLTTAVFTTFVEKVYTIANDSLLFVQYPDEVRTHVYRKENRIQCELQGGVNSELDNLNGQLLLLRDLSASGARIEIDTGDNQPDKATLSQLIEQKLTMEISMEIFGDPRVYKINSEVRNANVRENKLTLGLMITDEEDNDSKAFYSRVVSEQIQS